MRARHEAALIPFAVAGDPDLDTSEEILRTFIRAGADILEIGFPFSDPVADGPVNQRAAHRAISAGITHAAFFALIKRLRAASDIPFGLLCYANSVHHLGYDTFCSRAARSGLDSLLVADMPPEEATELARSMRRHGLSSVYIVSELTPPPRMRYICDRTDGFVYVVSRLGPTGPNRLLSKTVAPTLTRLKRVTRKPLCVGFGLSKPAHIAEVIASGAHGAIVGSALVKIVEEKLQSPRTMLRMLETKVRILKKATLA